MMLCTTKRAASTTATLTAAGFIVKGEKRGPMFAGVIMLARETSAPNVS